MLGVIGTHAEVYEGAVRWAASILSKWSVPYFFLVLGYFIGKKTGVDRTSVAIERVFLMFLIASVVLLPLAVIQHGFYQTYRYVLHSALYSGSFFHLWYLSSLLLGLLVFRLLDTPARRPWMPWIAIVSLAISITLTSYLVEETRMLGRHLMSIPFLWLGTMLARRVPSLRQSVGLIMFGIGIEVLESWVLKVRFNRDIWSCQLIVGTVAYAVGMFGVAYHLPSSPVLKRFASLGGRYGGSIYITHPYALACMWWLGGVLDVKQCFGFKLLLIPISMLLDIAVLRLIDYLAPSFIDGLLGSKAALIRWSQTLIRIPRPIRDWPSRS